MGRLAEASLEFIFFLWDGRISVHGPETPNIGEEEESRGVKGGEDEYEETEEDEEEDDWWQKEEAKGEERRGQKLKLLLYE